MIGFINGWMEQDGWMDMRMDMRVDEWKCFF